MARKQTRRSLHLNATTRPRLEAFCAAHRIAKSALVEYLLACPDAPPGDFDAFRAWNAGRRDRLGRTAAAVGRATKQTGPKPDPNCRARRAARMVLDDGSTQADAARALGIAEPTVSRYVGLLRSERAEAACV